MTTNNCSTSPAIPLSDELPPELQEARALLAQMDVAAVVFIRKVAEAMLAELDNPAALPVETAPVAALAFPARGVGLRSVQ